MKKILMLFLILSLILPNFVFADEVNYEKYDSLYGKQILTNVEDYGLELKKEKIKPDYVMNHEEFMAYANVKIDNPIDFSDVYFDDNNYAEKGIPTFRGSNFRDKSHYGNPSVTEENLTIDYYVKTTGGGSWGGGSGWTGQSVITEWTKEELQNINVYDKFKNMDTLKEVIQGSLDGNVYFYNFETGEKTRPTLKFGNVIKGSVSIHPNKRLLFVGSGVKMQNWFGFKIYDLYTQKELFFQNGYDGFNLRGWGAFDGNPLIDVDTDSMFLGGENGVLYLMKLNPTYGEKQNSIKPSIMKIRYLGKGVSATKVGIENSIAGYKDNIYFADNYGFVFSFNLTENKFNWVFRRKDLSDDTNSSISISIEDGETYLYYGNESDVRQNYGDKNCSFMKLDTENGEIVWSKQFKVTKTHSNGGIYGTQAIGKDFVYVTVSNIDSRAKLFALNKKTGEEVWNFYIPTFAWSSPHLITSSEGKEYIVQADGAGNVYLVDGLTGNQLDKEKLNGNVEMSPSGFESGIIYGTRVNTFYKLSIK